MTSVIWKYPLTSESGEYRLLPGAKVLTVQNQNGAICIWAMGEVSDARETRRFVVRGTGLDFEPAANEVFVGTVQLAGGLVMHVFEVRR